MASTYTWNTLNAEALNKMVDSYVGKINKAVEMLKKVQNAEGYTEADAAMTEVNKEYMGGDLALYLRDPENSKLVKGGTSAAAAGGGGEEGGFLSSIGSALGSAMDGIKDLVSGDTTKDSPAYKMHQNFLASFNKTVQTAREHFRANALVPFVMNQGEYICYWMMSLKSVLSNDKCGQDLYDNIKFSFNEFSRLMEDIPQIKKKYADMDASEDTKRKQIMMDVADKMKSQYSVLCKFIKPDPNDMRVYDLANVTKCVDSSTAQYSERADATVSKMGPLMDKTENAIAILEAASQAVTDMMASRVISAEIALVKEIDRTVKTACAERSKYANESGTEAPYAFLSYESIVVSVSQKYLLPIERHSPQQSGTKYFDLYKEMVYKIKKTCKE